MAQLKEAASASIAVAELDEEVALEVGLLLHQYDRCEAQIERAEAHLAERKRAAGKSKMNSLGHCMSKALNLI